MAGDEQGRWRRRERGRSVVLVSRALITALICGISSVHSNSNSYGDSKTVGKTDREKETDRERGREIATELAREKNDNEKVK